MLKEIPRVGKRKPIQNKDAPQKQNPIEKSQNVFEKALNLPETLNKQFQNDSTLKNKINEVSQNMVVMSLPPSSNVKNFGISLGKQTLTNKDKDVQREKKSEGKKKQVDLITTVFLLGYNQIRDLAGIGNTFEKVMYDTFERLHWLDLQHNYLTTVSEELNVFKQLKTLYLHANYIPSIKEFTNIRGLTQLRNLTVHGNPLVRIPNFRLFFIAIFPNLKKLDTVLISKKERDNSRVLFEDFKFKNFPVYNEGDLPLPPAKKDPNGNKDE